MALRVFTPDELMAVREAIDSLRERGDAGRHLREYLFAELEPGNEDQAIRCALANLQGAITEIKTRVRDIKYGPVFGE